MKKITITIEDQPQIIGAAQKPPKIDMEITGLIPSEACLILLNAAVTQANKELPIVIQALKNMPPDQPKPGKTILWPGT
jgi:hypothetical protein